MTTRFPSAIAATFIGHFFFFSGELLILPTPGIELAQFGQREIGEFARRDQRCASSCRVVHNGELAVFRRANVKLCRVRAVFQAAPVTARRKMRRDARRFPRRATAVGAQEQ